MAKNSIGGRALKRFLRAGVNNFSHHVELINGLNVFPVPDGDTGINMFHTLERAYREIERLDNDDASLIAKRFAYGALMGARGNSGTILSQLLKGFAAGLAHDLTLTTERFAVACQNAVKQGYASVSAPTEGTILTVAREATEALQSSHCDPDSLGEALETLIAAARASLENTPNLLPILRDAGVVDAGGMGLLCFLEGLQAGPARQRVSSAPATPSLTQMDNDAETYGYDVQFLMLGADLDVAQARRDLEQMGWSVIVVGDSEMIKVHIHVDNPAIPLDYAIRSGAALADIVVENMEIQYQQRILSAQTRNDEPESLRPDLAVIAVVEGAGLRKVYRELGCSAIVLGGAGSNPATEDFVAAIQQAPSERVIILPNDRNIVLAARQAADLATDKRVDVVATETVLQGIGAMMTYGDALDSKADCEAIAAMMRAAGDEIRSIEITRASRATRFRDIEINQNDFIALLDGMICSASTELFCAALKAFALLPPNGLELATVYYGAGVSRAEADQLIRRLTKSLKGLEFELVYGGQSLYPFLISVE